MSNASTVNPAERKRQTDGVGERERARKREESCYRAGGEKNKKLKGGREEARKERETERERRKENCEG